MYDFAMNNKVIGAIGEKIAQDYLKKLGFVILETNYRYSKISEIDIIAHKNDILHFIEVKTRSGYGFGTPFEAVTKSKLKSVFLCANYYLSNINKKFNKIQIDVIGIILSKNSNPEIHFIEDIAL